MIGRDRAIGATRRRRRSVGAMRRWRAVGRDRAIGATRRRRRSVGAMRRWRAVGRGLAIVSTRRESELSRLLSIDTQVNGRTFVNDERDDIRRFASSPHPRRVVE